MKTVIIGKRSSLTQHLNKIIKDTLIISSNDILENNYKKKIPKQFNLIINLFYPSNKLSKKINYDLFFNLNILYLKKFLNEINRKSINKIIYTSSSSVNNNSNFFSNSKNLYSISKLLSENYIFSIKELKKKTIIARVFNMFDDNEDFSIISKIVTANRKKETIFLNNKGQSIRDFIYTGDVAKIYKKLLTTNLIGKFNIGTGNGYKIIDLIKCTDTKYKFKKQNIYEQDISVANISRLKPLIKRMNFLRVEKFFKKKKILKLKLDNINYSFPNSYLNNANTMVIYGAGYSGKKICNEFLKNNKNVNIFFIDDDKKKIGKKYKKSPILDFNNFRNIHKSLKITSLIIAIPSLDNQSRKNLIKKISKYYKNISILPPKEQIINKSITINDLRDVNFSDILDRNTSKLNTNLIKYLDNQNVLITGGAGSIGSELVKQIYNTNSKKIILFDNNETELFRLLLNFKKQKVIPILGDICDEEYLRSIIKKFKIDYVFHAAAYKHLSILENNFQSAIKNNLIGTISVLKSLNKNVKNFTLISTDKAANPISNLGISKRLAEIFTLSWKKNKTSVVRFGNVFASRGSVLEVFLNQLKNNHPLTVSHRLVSRYFMSIKEACNLVLQTNSLNFKNSIYLLNMGKPIKIIKIAESLLKFFRLNEYPIKYTYLKKGEKINEILSSSNKKFKTKHKDIFVIKEKNYSEKKVNEFFNFLISNFEFIEKQNIQRKIKKFIN